jgi:hypothetical protein
MLHSKGRGANLGLRREAKEHMAGHIPQSIDTIAIQILNVKIL